MKVIGLTGGIASGKSTIAKMLKKLGAVVIDADQVAREVVEPGQPALREIAVYFGKEVLLPDGSLNRSALAQIIFHNLGQREKLNRIIHPRVIQRIKEQLADLNQSVAIIEVPLLIEAGMTEMVDEIWVATADRDLQIQRLKGRDNLSLEEIQARIDSQLSTADRLQYADVVIDTGNSISITRDQVLKHWQRISSQ